MLVLQCILQHIYRGAAHRHEILIDLLERGLMYPPFDLCIDARAMHGAISATDVCEFAGSILTFRLV